MKLKKFSDRLRLALFIAGATQAQVAEKSGLQQSTISQLLSGKRQPNYKTLCMIAKAFELPGGYWLGMKEGEEIINEKYQRRLCLTALLKRASELTW